MKFPYTFHLSVSYVSFIKDFFRQMQSRDVGSGANVFLRSGVIGNLNREVQNSSVHVLFLCDFSAVCVLFGAVFVLFWCDFSAVFVLFWCGVCAVFHIHRTYTAQIPEKGKRRGSV